MHAAIASDIMHSALSLSAAHASGKRPDGAVHTYHFDHVTSFGDKFWLPSSITH